jgi:hypothetical protein
MFHTEALPLPTSVPSMLPSKFSSAQDHLDSPGVLRGPFDVENVVRTSNAGDSES